MADDQTFVFGQKIADDYVPAEAGGDVQWIRTFKDSSTQIRICPAVGTNARGERVTGYKAWKTEREHYDEDLQLSYACTQEYGVPEADGVGCKHSSKDVRDRSRKYYVNALDKDGVLRIFKFGPAVYNILKMRQDRMMSEDPSNDQPLSDRDYIINKSGSGKSGTRYDVESGDKYPVEGGWPEEMHDITAAITAAHAEAMAKYSGDEPLGKAKDDDDRAVQTSPVAKQDEPPARPAKKAAAKKTAAPASNGGGMTVEGLEDLSTAQIREWVEANKPESYELPAVTPRSKITTIAEAILTGDMPPF